MTSVFPLSLLKVYNVILVNFIRNVGMVSQDHAFKPSGFEERFHKIRTITTCDYYMPMMSVKYRPRVI